MLSTALSLTLLLEASPAVAEPPRYTVSRRIAFAGRFGLHWSPLSGVPSGEVSLFLGSTLLPRYDRRGRAWKSALGYEIGLSMGGADRATAFLSWGGDYGVFYHRHHVAVAGYGGPGDRLFYHFGGGLMLWRTTPVALEADARLGVVLGPGRPGRVKGVVGGEARIVGILGGVPFPHVGVFAGLFVF
jgi:hypothetical protein